MAIAAMATSCLISWGIFLNVLFGSDHGAFERSFAWFKLSGNIVHIGVLLDPLAAVMLIIVTSVAVLVQVYSLGYMHGESRLNWYYAALSLFTFAMLGVVVSSSLFPMLISWELVGLCSYLLIGFWYQRPDAGHAAKKAFLTTRAGDVGFLLGVILFFVVMGTFHIPTLVAEAATVDPTLLTVMVLLLFAGAIGKSAQFPLHVWLPDAMAGPTPVSALIHAATMVAAGVYLVARTYPIFEMAPLALEVVAYIGITTAFLAATIALTQVDIKKVLAYSTVSQLGYMMVGLGAGSLATGMFHLTTHAAFKALLFLTAGSVIHATHTQDIREMGRVFPKMKITAITTIIGGLALAGVPPFGGFWSKDEILVEAAHNHFGFIYIVAVITAGLTAFYTFRMIFLAFFGEGESKAHESPRTMTIPLIILAVAAVFIGLFNAPFFGHQFSHFLGGESIEPDYTIMASSVAIAGIGIFLAYLLYYKPARSTVFSRITGRLLAGQLWIQGESVRGWANFLAVMSFNKYWIDEFYQIVIVRPAHALATFLFRFDLTVIDGIVNWIGWSSVSVAYSVGGIDFSFLEEPAKQPGRLAGFIRKLFGTLGQPGEPASSGPVQSVRYGWVARGFDLVIVDGIVNGVSLLVMGAGKRFRRIQTGYLQSYPLVMFMAVLSLILVVVLAGKE